MRALWLWVFKPVGERGDGYFLASLFSNDMILKRIGRGLFKKVWVFDEQAKLGFTNKVLSKEPKRKIIINMSSWDVILITWFFLWFKI